MTHLFTYGWNRLIALLVALLASIIASSNAHQSISYPTPISFDLACRIGLGRNCPGPCPTHLLRKDQSPNHPSVTVRRDGILPVHVLKNNHVGGFSRWSLVRVSDMHDKKEHAESSFLFTCADVEVTYCTRGNQERDCKVDRMNQFFRHYLRIPKVYPDGYYVLGWMWYGGAVSTGTHGAFGDYYDCIYIRVKGGPLEDSYQPIFKAGKSMTGRDGLCKATTNRVGHCFREPCPFGNRVTAFMKPEEFEGKEPKKLLRKNFEKASHTATSSGAVGNGFSKSSGTKPSKPSTKASPKSKVKATAKPKLRKTRKPRIKISPTTAVTTRPSPTSTTTAIQSDTAEVNAQKHSTVIMQSTTSDPSMTPKLHREEAKKLAMGQRKREKKLRRKQKMRERRQKKMRKTEERKAKREAKRLLRKKIREEKKLKRERKRIQKRLKKEEKRARRIARKQAKKHAKREAKKSGKRSLTPSEGENKEKQYDDCFEEGIFPEDDGHIDYGDPLVTAASS